MVVIRWQRTVPQPCNDAARRTVCPQVLEDVHEIDHHCHIDPACPGLGTDAVDVVVVSVDERNAAVAAGRGAVILLVEEAPHNVRPASTTLTASRSSC